MIQAKKIKSSSKSAIFSNPLNYEEIVTIVHIMKMTYLKRPFASGIDATPHPIASARCKNSSFASAILNLTP